MLLILNLFNTIKKKQMLFAKTIINTKIRKESFSDVNQVRLSIEKHSTLQDCLHHF